MVRRFRHTIVLALLVAFSATVRAQSEKTTTPPRVESSTDVPYPPEGRGDTTVELELVVDKQGAVSRVVVTEGAEPFAEHARRAALAWRFTPARRAGAAVASRIRARVAFHQGESPDRPRATDSPARVEEIPNTSASGPPPEPAPDVPVDVTVVGSRREIGQTTLSAAEAREMPGAFGDPFRAIEVFPSVTPVVSGLPFFYIRGAPPNDNAYSIDGIRVPLLFHVGIGEGVIHPALVDHVDFYPSAAPAAYGRSAGAAIAGKTRDPAAVRHGEVNLRLIDTGALLESPFADGRATALVAGRYGYPGPVIGAITPTVKLGYWDYQARATLRVGVGDRDSVGLFAFGSHDYLGTAQTRNGETGPIVEQLGSDFHRLDLRYDRALGNDSRLRVAATLGYDSQGGAGGGDGTAVTTITNRSAAVRVEVDESLSPSVLLRGGADAQLDHYGFAQGEAPTDPSGSTGPQVPSSADPPPTNVTWGAHADVVWRVSSRVEIVPGARVDVFESTRSSTSSSAPVTTTVPAFDPRLSTRVTIAPGLAWLASFGLSHQYPALRVGAVPAMLLTVPGFPLGGSELQTVAQASQGIEVALPADFTLTTTAFSSSWSGLTDLTANCVQIMPPTTPPQSGNSQPPPPPPYACPNNAPVHGRAYGVEVLLRRALSRRLSGWLSYTLSRSTREEHFLSLSGGDTVATVASDYDRTHMLNAVLAYDLGGRWRAGTRFVFFSGTPYSNLSGNVPVPPYNGERDPPFFRLDVRLEKRWMLGKDGYIAFVAEGQNVTLSKEVTPFGLSCMGTQGPTGGTNQCRHSAIGPITIPSIGVEASY